MGILKGRQSIINNVLLILMMVPLAIYAYYVFHFAINVPRQDDYDAILGFLINFDKASFSEKIIALFSQHNEHRIFFSNVVYALYYSVTGGINFAHIIYLNLAILVTLFAAIVYFIRQAIPGHWHIAAVVLSFAMFDINNFENADFAMAGLQNYGVILLFMGSMFFYSKQGNKYLLPAVLLQAICVFSSGNGNIGSFFILLFVILGRSRPKIIAALSTFLIAAPLYYVGYEKATTDFFTTDPAKFLPFFSHVAAAHFSNEHGVIIGVLLITLLLAMLPLGKKFAVKSNALPLLCLTGFILASAGVMSIFRGNMDIMVAYSSRYFVYSHLLVGILFVFVIIKLQAKEKILLPVNIAVLLLILFIYKQNAEYGNGGFEWQHNCRKERQYDYPIVEKAKQITDEACQLGIYCLDDHRQD